MVCIDPGPFHDGLVVVRDPGGGLVSLVRSGQALVRWALRVAASAIVLLGVSLIATPAYFTGKSLVGTLTTVRQHLGEETVRVPQLPVEWSQGTGLRRTIADQWPSDDGELATFVRAHSAEVKAGAKQLLRALGGFTVTTLMFIAAFVIAGFMMANAKVGGEVAERFLSRAMGAHGASMVDLTTSTIRNVAKGILGVALIQTAMFAAGVFIAGVPAAGLLCIIALMLCIVQIGVAPVAIGVMIYAFAAMNTGPAIMLTVWLVITMISDNILKPILLGRGAAVPTAVIFLEAIGGFILSGIIGLFTGAVVLSIGYRLMVGWMAGGEEPRTTAD